jgi:hypothetical protein
LRPLVIIPVLRPSEPWERAVTSALKADCRVLIIDNSEGQIEWPELPEDVWLTQPYQNLGCAGSWNFGMRSSVSEPYWLVMNADCEVTTTAVDYLKAQMVEAGTTPAWVGVDGDWRVFAINPAWLEEVGWFDDNLHPIYMEDCDMEYRARIAGVPVICHRSQPTGSTHADGRSWKSVGPALGEFQNSKTHEQNRVYYKQKWGGGHRGGEVYASPFNAGHTIKHGPSILRLRRQTWRV